MMGYLIERVMH